MKSDILYIQGEPKKKSDLKKHGHNYSEIYQKEKKLVCFGKFSLNAAGQAPNLSKMAQKNELEVGQPPLELGQN